MKLAIILLIIIIIALAVSGFWILNEEARLLYFGFFGVGISGAALWFIVFWLLEEPLSKP